VAWWVLLGLFVVGAVAGAINTLAGAGSLLTLPALLAFGLPAAEANATNRVGVLFQSISGAARFRRDGVLTLDGLAPVLVPLILGAALGAWISVDIDEALFRRIIGGLMLAMLVVLFLRADRFVRGRDGEAPAHLRWTAPLAFFALGVYGGFLQAGIGVFLTVALVWASGKDLVRVTAMKSVVVGAYTLPSLAIFLWFDLVSWGPGLALALGGMVGAWVGARLGVRFGAGFLKWVIAAVVLVSAVVLLAGG
jgi:uncharacterized membrane protein YfcA